MSTKKRITLKTRDDEELKLDEAVVVTNKNVVQDVNCASNVTTKILSRDDIYVPNQ